MDNAMKKALITAAAMAIGFGGFVVSVRAADAPKETKAEKVHEQHEKEELGKMPAGARRALRTATEGATNVDYFKLKTEGHNVFGATYVGVDKKHWEIRYDSEGKQLSKAESAADAAADAAAAAAAAAAAQKATDDAAKAAAMKAAELKGTPIVPGVVPTVPGKVMTKEELAREMAEGHTSVADMNAFPAPVKERIASEIIGCKNVKYYTSTANGMQLFESEYDTLDKVHYRLRVQPNGRIFSKHEEKGEEKLVSRMEPVELSQTPVAARKMLQTETFGVKHPEFFKVTEAGKVSYEAAFAAEAGKTEHVRISEEGKILSKHTTGGTK